MARWAVRGLAGIVVALGIGILTFAAIVLLALAVPEVVRGFTGPAAGGTNAAVSATTVVLVVEFVVVILGWLAVRLALAVLDRRRRSR